MTIKEIEQLITILGIFSAGAVIGGGIIFLFIKSFIPSYLNEKGKSLATKEDIAGITDEIEGVKSGYSSVLEELKSEKKLKHASIEREKNIKKEVYLQAVEAVTRSQNMIVSFSNLILTNENITANMVEDTGIMAKVQIVGSKKTVKATTAFMAAIGSKTLELILERSALIDRKSRIEVLETLKEMAGNEIESYVKMMKNLNLEDNQNQAVWLKINVQVDFEQGQFNQYTNEIADLWDVQSSEYVAFSQKCFDTFIEVSRLLPPIILSVRNELDLDIEPEDYLDIFNSNLDTGKKVFDKFFLKLEAKA
jgi:hypothetical protein